ncbi:MAG: hypothetical protein ACREN8_02590 [Candidatus Dormibacteraceae bacterium]
MHDFIASIYPNLQPNIQNVDISGDTLRAGVTKLAGNFFLAILGVLGALALFRRRMVEVLELAGLAILSGLFIYKPDTFGSISNAVTSLFISH